MNYYLYLKDSKNYASPIWSTFKQNQNYYSLNKVQKIIPPAISIVHETAFNDDANQKQLVTLLAKCELVIFFTEDHSRPEIHHSAPVNGPICWESHPKYIVKFFDRLISMLGNKDSENWDVNKWVPLWPEHLVAAYLLQVAMKSANPLDIGKLAINDDFWDKALEEFREQKKQINGTDITEPDSLFFDQGCEELGKLLKKIAKAKVL